MRDYEELVKALRDEDNCNVLDYIDEAADAIEDLEAALTASNEAIAKSRGKWISVEERLPEDGVFVLAANDDGKMLVAKYESEVLGWYLKYCCYDFDVWDSEENGPVTHWMPLPLPPKEEEK
jgi:hypothetical protein